MAEENILSLDELFGQAQMKRVKHEGTIYELPVMETLSPKKWQRIQALGKSASALQNDVKGGVTPEHAKKIEALLDEMLTLLCPALPIKPVTVQQKLLAKLRLAVLPPRPLTFDEKQRVLMYYMGNQQKKVPTPRNRKR